LKHFGPTFQALAGFQLSYKHRHHKQGATPHDSVDALSKEQFFVVVPRLPCEQTIATEILCWMML